MDISSKTRIFIAWLVLVAITIIYLWIDHSADESGALVASTTVTVTAIFLALVKFRIVLREFMDVRLAPVVLRRATDILVVAIAVSLYASYVIGRAVA
jgi:hypothetical protein